MVPFHWAGTLVRPHDGMESTAREPAWEPRESRAGQGMAGRWACAALFPEGEQPGSAAARGTLGTEGGVRVVMAAPSGGSCTSLGTDPDLGARRTLGGF